MFYNVQARWIDNLKLNYLSIRDELDVFLKENSIKIDSKYSFYTNNNGWNTVPLVFFTIKIKNFMDYFPRTSEFLNEIPELIGAEFSILKPNTIIKPHIGYSKVIMRTHLGLKIPQGDLGFKCLKESRSWMNGNTFSFNDGEIHEAWNKSTEERWILMVDTPIPESKYNANDISKYKLDHLEDETLLQIAPKKEWLLWYNQGHLS